ncbi:Thioesterase-like superfamily protein [Syntrophus gentianae]|uniref:Thioesterase-like superfamily protein n=1 Tax=Syntrophus gentianae TaxID=43775 RepID=A0A1H7YEV8_9BACT|nr:thioesterase family protein [Syntrophus gentianae]SEM43857.1 Thioesterase-like superfamily protein [Syntrophus gentianae]
MNESPTAFFRQISKSEFEPSVATQGPWSPDFQHGGPPSSLLTHIIRTQPSNGHFRIIRVTVEILSPVPVKPCEIKVEVVRRGKRIELLRGEYLSEGRTYLIAHAWRIRSEVGVTSTISDFYEIPALPESQVQDLFSIFGNFPYVNALEWRFARGGFDALGPATVWTRQRIPLIENHEIDGLEALVLMIDSANGISAELDFQKWTYVPVDLTLGIYRQPEGPWFGMDARTVIGNDGSGQTTTVAFDSKGKVGHSLHTLFIRPR